MEEYTEEDVQLSLKAIGYNYNKQQLRYSKNIKENESLIRWLWKIQRENFFLFVAVVNWFLTTTFTEETRVKFNPYFLIIADIIAFQLFSSPPQKPPSYIDLDERVNWMYEEIKDKPKFTFQQKANKSVPRIEISWAFDGGTYHVRMLLGKQ